MGMSASQARFLSLTARKNNVEFEGQQINQQRTTLSNESASYYSELCNMAVPTPPSIDDYTKVSYTFNDGAMTNTLTSLLPDTTTEGRANNRYVVNYVEEWQDDYAIVPAASSLVEANDTNNPTEFSIGSVKLRTINDTDIGYITGDDGHYYEKDSSKTATQDSDGNYYVEFADTPTADQIANGVIIEELGGKKVNLVNKGTDTNPQWVYNVNADSDGKYDTYKEITAQEKNTLDTNALERAINALQNDEYGKTLSDEQKRALLENEKYLLKMVQEKTGDNGNFYIRYIKNTTTGNYEPYLYAESELKQKQKYNNKKLGSIPCYSLGSTTQTREVLHKEATVEKDSSGRYVAITINLGTDSSGKKIERTYSLTTTTTTDEEAYNDAMNQYNYAQHEYDHKIQEINSKLEIVQQQDKQLELKLKQLDTEENAISTEMDAVKKVISKNVESSFKTFNA